MILQGAVLNESTGLTNDVFASASAIIWPLGRIGSRTLITIEQDVGLKASDHSAPRGWVSVVAGAKFLLIVVETPTKGRGGDRLDAHAAIARHSAGHPCSSASTLSTCAAR